MWYEVLVAWLVAAFGVLSLYLDPGTSIAASGVSMIVASNVFVYSLYKGGGLPILFPALPAILLTQSVCRVLGVPEHLVDPALLLTLLAAIAFHWDVPRVRALFNPSLPPALLAGILIGVWVGTQNPVRFCLTPIVEVIGYTVIRDRLRGGMSMLYVASLPVALYLNQATYVSLTFLGFSIILYLVKAVAIEVRHEVAPYITAVDVLIRPALAGVSF